MEEISLTLTACKYDFWVLLLTSTIILESNVANQTVYYKTYFAYGAYNVSPYLCVVYIMALILNLKTYQACEKRYIRFRLSGDGNIRINQCETCLIFIQFPVCPTSSHGFPITYTYPSIMRNIIPYQTTSYQSSYQYKKSIALQYCNYSPLIHSLSTALSYSAIAPI